MRANRFLPPTLIATFVVAGCLVAPGSAAAEPTIQTTTKISCGTAILFPGREPVCQVRVRSSTGATVPRGTVKLTAEGGQIPASCTLLPFVGPESVCTPRYTTKEGGLQTISAGYLGSETHLPSNGSTTISVSDTATSLICQPVPLVLGETSTCTAKVSNTGAASDSLSGTVSFSASGEGQQLEPSSCTLGEGNACSVNFTPKVSGDYRLTATYEGDATHPASQGKNTVIARDATAATVSCGSGARFPHTGLLCQVRIRSLGANATPATGSAFITMNGLVGPPCELLQLPFSKESFAACRFTLEEEEGGLHTITAVYPGDHTHLPSSGDTTVGITSTATRLTCQPESIAVGESSICTADVENTGAASDSLSGSVSFKSESQGRFEPGACTVNESGICTVKFFPEVGAEPHIVTATYGGDATHPASNTSARLAVRGTSVTLVCSQRVELNEPGSCLARVVNNGLGSRSLSGKVRFTSSAKGRFSSPECTLAPFLDNDGGFCGSSYTPETAGTHVIHAFYSGDDTHPPAIDGKAQVEVLP